ncbi:MAG: carboxypeptidase regulatory-like domain-containing protein [Bacteroidales bacterium]|nr:carboxypeptidase regulatory-like domain-containing protein [Bacteroidales bacterium]
MKHLTSYISMLAGILLAGMVSQSCSGDDDSRESQHNGSIYGLVTDYATGHPVQYANVQLRPTGETTLTGLDGMYEFRYLANGTYYITVSKAEYSELKDDYPIDVVSGQSRRRDVQIEALPVYISIKDMMGNPLTELDFGSNPSLNLLAFNVFNNGTVPVRSIAVYSCDWMSVTPSTCDIDPGRSAMFTVQLDRTKLPAGSNSTQLYIQTGNGSNVIEVRAVGGYAKPEVLTLPITYIDGNVTPWSNTFHAKVNNAGNPEYTNRGFCFSSTNSEPTVNGSNCTNVNVVGTGVGEYSYTYWDFPPQTTLYFVRAWVKWNNQIEYGNIQQFVYNDV